MGLYTVIDNRAWKALSIVANDFKSIAPITSVSKNRIEGNGTNLGVEGLCASYEVNNRWMGRVYIFRWQCNIPDSKPTEDIKISLKYKGKIGENKKPYFSSKHPLPLIERLNQDSVIRKICQSIDFELFTLKYSKQDQVWSLEIRPNYGDFVWILLPPVRYMRRPSKAEVELTVKLIRQVSKYIKE